MDESRQAIPDPIQREVRQRCGFGCVICGQPLYEYHHMISYSETKRHVPEEITLLCDRHHTEATKGLLTTAQVSQANENPFNVQRGISSPYGIHFEGPVCNTVIGSNKFCGVSGDEGKPCVSIPVCVDDCDLIAFQIDPNGHIFLIANIFDECNNPILRIYRNCLLYKTDLWDIEFKGRTLTIRQSAGQIMFEVQFSPPNLITISRARLLCNGVEILVRPSHIFVANSNSLYSQNLALGIGSTMGLHLGRNDRNLSATFGGPPVPRYLLSKSEVEKREKDCLEKWEKDKDLVKED